MADEHVEQEQVEQEQVEPDSPTARAALAADLLARNSDEGSDKGEADSEADSEAEKATEAGSEAAEKDSDSENVEASEPGDSEKKHQLEKSWEILAQREKAQREKEKEIKERVAKAEELESFINKLKEDPYSYLDELGVTYEDWTEKVLSGKAPESNKELKKIEEKIDKLAKDKEKEKQTEEERKIQEQHAAAYKEYAESVFAACDKSELIKQTDTYNDVLEYAGLYYNETQQIPEPEKAVEAVENYLKENLKRQLQTETGKAIVAELGLIPETKPEKEEKKQKHTLSNSMSGQSKAAEDEIPETTGTADRMAMARKLLRDRQASGQ